jgi:hypothetical protein
VSFLIVDNGTSTGELQNLVDSHQLENTRCIILDRNCGFGGGILEGIKNVESSHVGWMPGNLRVEPRDAVSLWRSWRGEGPYRAVKAKRRGRDPIANLKTWAAGLLNSLFYARNLMDSGGTPTLAETQFMKDLAAISPTGYEFEVFVMYAMRRSKIQISRPGVNYKNRKYGHSHWQTSIRSEFNLLVRMLSQKRELKIKGGNSA